MKKNVFVRILAALGGLTLWMMGLCALAETFFHVQVTARLGQLLGAHTPLAVLATLLLAILLCAFGVSCWMMLSPKRAVRRSGFVMQKGENGAIGVSIRSIEGLVQTCVRQHEVVASAEISVVERRDGIVILLDIEEVAGVNIPLSVAALQKQIRQYVTACTGVDVHEVRVLVENTESSVVSSPYAVNEPVVVTNTSTTASMEAAASAEVPAAAEPQAELPVVEPVPVEDAPDEVLAEEAVPVEESAQDSAKETAPVVQSVPVMTPIMPEILEDEDDRPLHQRLFGTEETPVFVPAPPEWVAEPAAEGADEELLTDIDEEIVPEGGSDAFDGNAVLEVVAAMTEEAAREEIDGETGEKNFPAGLEIAQEEL